MSAHPLLFLPTRSGGQFSFNFDYPYDFLYLLPYRNDILELLIIDPKKCYSFYPSPSECSFSGCSFLEYSLSKRSCHAVETQAT